MFKKLNKIKYWLIGVVIVVIALFTGSIGLQTKPIGVAPQSLKHDPSAAFDTIWAYASTSGKINQIKRFFPRWVNYKTADKWAKIDVSFTQTPSGFVMDKAPFEFTAPFTSTGQATFYNNNRCDNIEKKQITAPPLTLGITAENVNSVSGVMETGLIRGSMVEYVAYNGAYPYGDLIHYISFGKGPQAEKLIRIPANPNFTQDQVESFMFTYSEAVSFKRNVGGNKQAWSQGAVMRTKNEVDIKAKNTNQRRGIGLKEFTIWDSNPVERKVEQVQVDFQRMGLNTYRLSKIIPASFFTPDVVYPVFTDSINRYFSEDADHGTLVDGNIQHDTGNGGTWAASRDSTDATSETEGEMSRSARSQECCTDRFINDINIHLFATGDGIGASAIIDDARLGLFVTATVNGDDDGFDYIMVILTDPASDTTLATTDFDNVTDMANNNPHGAAVELRDMSDYSSTTTSYIDITNISTSAVLEIVINATGTPNIIGGAGGVTKFGLAIGHNIQNHPISAGADNAVNVEMAEGANPPYLEVEFSSGTPAVTDDDILYMPLWFTSEI